MRAAFDTTCDIVSGPYSPIPGVVRLANVPCRLVQERDIELVPGPIKPFDAIFAYVTMDAGYPATYIGTATGPGVYKLDFTGMEMLVMPSGGLVNFYPVLVQEVLPPSGLLYYRVFLRSSAP